LDPQIREMAMATEGMAELEEVVFQTAGEHVATRVAVARPGESVGDARRSLECGSVDTWPASP
jgi:hypothetical protein